MARVGTLAPAQAQRCQTLAKWLGIGLQSLLQVGDREPRVIPGLKAQWNGAELDGLQGDSFGLVPGLDHGLMDAVSEHRTIRFGAIVVLARRDVTATAGSIELKDLGQIGLPAP